MDVTLIRHAYVRTARQGQGIGARLLAHLREMASGPVLIGTWADAAWAIRFYRRHGFEVVTPQEKDRLLKKYWKIPERQVETSVVLADERGGERAGRRGQVDLRGRDYPCDGFSGRAVALWRRPDIALG